MYQDLDQIHTLVIHCSATVEGKWVDMAMIRKWHSDPKPKGRGWRREGYHRLIRLDGSVEQGRPFNERGVHVKGNNINTLGLCMVGGLDEMGKAKNTFTDDQMHSLLAEIIFIKSKCPNITKVCGHRDFSPDLNGDGVITPNEWIKLCPCFDVSKKIAEWRI